MGNSGSQPTGHHHTAHQHSRHSPLFQHPQYHHPQDEQWTQSPSYPRAPYQHKLVVPDRDAHQRLRPTGNGEILHAGGTISGRRQEWQQQQQQPQQQGGVNRSSSISAVRQQQQQQQSQQKTRIPVYRHNQPRVLTPSYRKDQIKRFGSEPDLRVNSASNNKSNNEHQDRYKARKKYKAPPPPSALTSLGSSEKHDFDEGCGMEAGSPIRRARLFKTRAETKKKISSPVDNRRYKSTDALFQAENDSNGTNSTGNNGGGRSRPPVPQMQRTRSSPEFQAELKQVTRRLVTLRQEISENCGDTSKLKTLDHNIHNNRSKKEAMRTKLKEMMIVEERLPASGKESTPDLSPPKVKTFYFGMNADEVPIQKQIPIPNSIGSDVSSESETENSTNDISLQLRPILPKKQLEIPRFSPAAAWKLLSTVDTVDSTIASEEGSLYVEDRIEKLSRPPPPYRQLPVGQRSNDKSGDSGISGDETPEAVLPNNGSPRQRGISWTPQQDLGDDSSLEDGSHLDFPAAVSKFPTKPHVFSLSLPRENHLATSIVNDKNFLQPYSSLQKLKRSMSGILSGAGATVKEEQETPENGDENWFLSRSAPNSLSLNNGFNSLELRRRQQDESSEGPKQRRIMYLPQAVNSSSSTHLVKTIKSRSKSCENISESRKPQNLQDPPSPLDEKKWTKKPKKFTFQSTVRQIERKRLADKLSREAERKERQRLRELEAMQRVEEEFQKKRAREKATIRQQLRLYSMDDSAWSSLPPNLDLDINDKVRQEPDGAVSSSSTSSPTFKKNSERERTQSTQILSEFRQSHREYKEFRGQSSRHTNEHLIHPRVTCNMPKATG